MAVANLTIGRQKFVVVPANEFARMKADGERYQKMLEADRALTELAVKELKAYRKDPSKGIPWEKVRKELGL